MAFSLFESTLLVPKTEFKIDMEGRRLYKNSQEIKLTKLEFEILKILFSNPKKVFTREEKRAWLDKNTDVALGSDAFFPFGDNIERAYKSGVKYIAQPGGSIRDDNVIETCNKRNIAMCFTGMRLFHH